MLVYWNTIPYAWKINSGDWIVSVFRLGPVELVLPEDEDRIQSPKRCVLKNKQEGF
jgi:hypothetical protein